jgi:hypothetical protein
VERLHASAEHLGDAGQLFDALDVQSDLRLQVIRRAAAGDEVEAMLG